jgi:hypothetical protein
VRQTRGGCRHRSAAHCDSRSSCAKFAAQSGCALKEGFMQQANPQAEAQPAPGSWLYLLERFDIGLVHLDRELRVVGMNDFARRCLPVDEKLPFGKLVTSFHPESSRAKAQFLIGQAECPVSNAPPMTMIINIPERVLLVKVSKVGDEKGVTIRATRSFSTTSPRLSARHATGIPHEARAKVRQRQNDCCARSRRRVKVESCWSMCSTYPSSARRATTRRSTLRREASSATSTSVIWKAASIRACSCAFIGATSSIYRRSMRSCATTGACRCGWRGPNRWRFRFPAPALPRSWINSDCSEPPLLRAEHPCSLRAG